MHLAGNQKGTAVLSAWTGYLAGATQSRQLARALRPLSIILIAGVAGVLLLVATATAPVLFGYHTYIVNGGSMEPALTRGSVAVTHPTSPRALRVGDIIAYHHTPENPPVLHRIVEVTHDDGQLGFITQGDQNKTPDSQPVSLQGPGDKVVYSVPYAGYVLSFAESGRGRFALIGVPLALLLVLFLRENRQSAKPRTERAVDSAGGQVQAAPAPPVASPFKTERAVDPLGDQVPTAPAPPVASPFQTKRAVDSPGDQAPTAPPPPVASPFQAKRVVDSPGDQVPAAPAPPVASPFQTERSQGDLPAFLVRQLQGRGPFEPRIQPAAASSAGGPVGLRGPPSPEWPQRTTRRVA
jgi:signal peptidase